MLEKSRSGGFPPAVIDLARIAGFGLGIQTPSFATAVTLLVEADRLGHALSPVIRSALHFKKSNSIFPKFQYGVLLCIAVAQYARRVGSNPYRAEYVAFSLKLKPFFKQVLAKP